MKTKILIILGLLFVSSMAGLNFNTNRCQQQTFNDYHAITCPCQGGKNLQFQYDKIPQGWYVNKQKIYIPRKNIQTNKFYGAKVTVFDKDTRQSLKKSLLFNFDNDNKINRIFDGQWDLNIDDRFSIDQWFNNRIKFNNVGNNINVYGANIDQRVVVPQQAQAQAQQFVPQQFVPQVIPQFLPQQVVAQQQFVPQQFVPQQFVPQVIPQQIVPQQFIPNQNQNTFDNRQINQNFRQDRDDNRIQRRRNNPYYDTFPRDEQIQKLLDNAQCGKIKDIIKYVGQSGFQCRQSASFLDKFQSKIQSRIAIYRAQAQRNKQNIFTLQQQCKKSDFQIEDYRKKSYNFNADSIHQRIRGYKQQINRHNRDRQSYQGNCKQNRNNLIQWRQQIQSIKIKTIQSRNIIQQQNRKISTIDIQILQLQDRLRVLKFNKQQSLNNRQRYQRILDQLQRRLDQLTNKCNSIQEQINGYESKSKYCFDAINDYNRKIEECNREIENGSKGIRDDDDKVRDMRNRNTQRQRQLARVKAQVQRLVALYTEIQRYQEEFSSAISRHYYGCYQYNPSNNNQNDKYDNNKFTAPSNAFLSYMKQVFGQAPNQNIRARFSGSAVNIKRNTIFSPSWTKVYGIPFSAGYGNNLDVMQDNFSCTQNDDKLKVFAGTIVDITKNVIEVVARTGDRYTVHLGGCTKLESITEKELPEKGSEIYFKGYQRQDKKSHYDGYHVTCY